VTNVINEWTSGLESSDYESVRELAVHLRKEGITFGELVSNFRRHNYVKKLGANEEQLESLIANLLDGARSIPHEKIVDLMNQLFEISMSELIPPTDVTVYINRKFEEKKKIVLFPAPSAADKRSVTSTIMFQSANNVLGR